MKILVSRVPDELFKKFITDFPSLKLKKKTPTTEWSRKLLEYFVKLGKEEGFETYCKKCGYEYFLDLSWNYEPEETSLEWIEVAFEIEFAGSLSSNIYEFTKLVDTKAYTKVLLCKSKVDEAQELFAQASEKIRHNPLRLPEEYYLIIVITETRKRFILTGVSMDFLGNTIILGTKEFSKD